MATKSRPPQEFFKSKLSAQTFSDSYLYRLFGSRCPAGHLWDMLSTEKGKEKVLILDTTIYDRSRSCKVELLSKVYDHCAKRYLNGFRMLTLGWSDGATFVPCDHAILTAPKEQNRIQGINKIMDRRTCVSRRRQETLGKCTDLIVPMVKRALNLSIPAK